MKAEMKTLSKGKRQISSEVKLRRERLRENLLFFAHFLISPAKLGTPLPTSREIGEAIAEELRKAGAEMVVELGSGLGSLTEPILEAICDGGKLLCIEKSQIFCRNLREKFGDRIMIIEGDAFELNGLLEGTEWHKPDAIVCSIPMAGDMAYKLCREMAEVLYPDGLLLQVTNYDSAIKQYFRVENSIRFKSNFPPEKLHIAYPKK